ncbi:hypothetical protein DID88_008006 [Monilinia fructigena]|uniref:Uncharacterized protein n=1 Tax=Monilinia fructigena TaxID=38457 RepID=A0A395J3Y3_9HELO|nr:hypothetical protein DID88_008006 [Monilinia fructigena]
MQAQYRSYQQGTPSRTSHAGSNRRGIAPATAAPTREQMTQQQYQQQQALILKQKEAAKKRASEPTDKNIPDGVEDVIIGDGVQRYKELRDVERRLDATMTRKRLDIRESVDRNVKRYRTLRIWISNTVEDQPWQSDNTLDVDAFDFSTNMDSSFRVKIEGRLLDDDDEDSEDSEDEDETAEDGADAMDVDKKKETKSPGRLYKLSHFFKSMTVDFDRNQRTKDGADQSVEWKKPSVAPNANGLPAAADFDQLEFKRSGDENCNIVINLVRDETPKDFQLSPVLSAILDTNVGTREEVTMLDERLKPLFPGREKGYWPQLGDAIISHTTILQPVRLHYTIRVDKEFHENPQPTIYDVQVTVEDPLKAALEAATKNPTYATNLIELSSLDKQLAVIFAEERLEIIAADGMRGSGEDATSDEWRRGGADSLWGSDNVKELAALMISTGCRAQIDVGKAEEWESVKEVVEDDFDGKLHLLALNAGFSQRGAFAQDSSTNYFNKILNVNLFGVINGINNLLPYITSHTSPSSIIITGSKQGITNPPGNPAYNCSKAAVKTLAEHLSFDLRERKETGVHLLVPGWTGIEKKPKGAWSGDQVVDYLEGKMVDGTFYVVCPDGDVTEEMDRKRMAWGAGDIVQGRLPLSRWREGYKGEFEEFMKRDL